MLFACFLINGKFNQKIEVAGFFPSQKICSLKIKPKKLTGIFFRFKTKSHRFLISFHFLYKILFYNNIRRFKDDLNSFLFFIVFFMFVAFSNLKLWKNWQW